MIYENKKVKILDCSFRDGGYYTNWIFKKELVQSYLELNNSGICDVVEVGLRTLKSGSYLGPHAYSSNKYFMFCKEYLNLKMSVLVNWKDIKSSLSNFKKLFVGLPYDFASLVRIVLKISEIKDVKEYVFYLKSKGYEVSLNIQNCDQILNLDNQFFISEIKKINPSILYIADTNGCLYPRQIKKLLEILVGNIDIPIGVHMHNNKGLAYANTIQAYESGAEYLDGTITGIGRGSGNAQTEYLSCFLKNISLDQKIKMNILIEKFFNPLKKEHLWGDNFYFFLSGENNQSASIMHNIISRKTYSNKSLVSIACSNQYDPLSKIAEGNISNKYTIDKPTAAIFANGTNWFIEKEIILNYLEDNKIKSFHINYPNNEFVMKYIDYFCSCDPIKITENIEKFKTRNNIPLLCPINIMKDYQLDYSNLNIVDFECIISESNLEINNQSCKIPFLQSLCFCLCYLYSQKFKNILLIGVQGFDDSNKNIEIINCINQLKIAYPDLEITSLNSNCLGIPSKSIFEITN